MEIKNKSTTLDRIPFFAAALCAGFSIYFAIVTDRQWILNGVDQIKVYFTMPSYPDHQEASEVQGAKELGPILIAKENLDTTQDELIDDSFNREFILNDLDGRISDTFSIHDDLKDRVAFWFDVYTKYDSNKRIIHIAKMPWVVFKVVDVTPIIEAPKPSRRWMRNEKAEKFVMYELSFIKKALKTISRKKRFTQLNPYEELVFNQLKKLPGKIQRNAKMALSELRVQTGQRDHFHGGLVLSSRYLGKMEEIFSKNGLPTELTRLPLVESSFNMQATSKVGAAGIWQFVESTGKEFLKISDEIDERRSPIKSSEAAALLLKENHLILHRSWPLAVTAWNHGPTGLRVAMKKTRSRELTKIVNEYRSKMFDFASSNFYAEFLAALYAEQYSDILFGKVDKEAPLQFLSYKTSRTMRTDLLFKATGLTEDEFLLYNPELETALKRKIKLPRGFLFHVPIEAKSNLGNRVAKEILPNSSKKSS